MMFDNPRLRAVLGAGSALVVVAGIGIGAAGSSVAAPARYVVAEAATGDVTQTYTGTGTITRKNTVEAAFAVDGTVKGVAVAVGDQVAAGDPLATLNRAALQLAVLNAQTSVARAEAALYAARHPSSTRTGSSSGGSGTPSGASGVTIDPKLLNEAAARANLAVLAEADQCTAIFAAILPEAEPTPTASPEATPTTAAAGPDPAASSEPAATPTADATPTPSASPEPTVTTGPTATTDPATAEPSPGPSQLAEVGDTDFTAEQLQACANARAEVLAANENLQAVVATLANPGGGRPSSGGSGASGSGSSASATVSAAAVAAARADLLAAEQALAGAQADLAAATLAAPIAGTVAVVGLAKGDSSAAGSITIVGAGSAVVTLELPLATRGLVEVGREVTVTPAGSTTTLAGTITGIAALATSGTSGDSATYTTDVSVSDAAGRLASGARAAVLIPVKAETGVLRVPASAVTPTGTGSGTVQVVDGAAATSATTVEVQTGAVGGGWVQVTAGLQSGQLVVLADSTAEIPSNTTSRRTATTSRTQTESGER